MDKGDILFFVDRQRLRRYKLISYIIGVGGIIILVIWPFIFVDLLGIKWNTLFGNICFVEIYIFAFLLLVPALICDIVKLNMFAIYEKGISPPRKPWRALFVRDYFIPYSEIKEILFSEKRPMNYEIVLKSGKVLKIGPWYIYKFLSEEDYLKVDKYMRIAAELVQKNTHKEKVK